MIKYVLLSQGIKIYETYDREEAETMADESNAEWYEYREQCAENYEPCADNEIEIVEEECE